MYASFFIRGYLWLLGWGEREEERERERKRGYLYVNRERLKSSKKESRNGRVRKLGNYRFEKTFVCKGSNNELKRSFEEEKIVTFVSVVKTSRVVNSIIHSFRHFFMYIYTCIVKR